MRKEREGSDGEHMCKREDKEGWGGERMGREFRHSKGEKAFLEGEGKKEREGR